MQLAKSKEEIFNETAYQTKKLLDKPIILYIQNDKGNLEPIIFKKDNDTDIKQYITEEEHAVAEWGLKIKNMQEQQLIHYQGLSVFIYQ